MDKTLVFYDRTYYISLLFNGYNLVFQCWKCIKGCFHIQISHFHLFLYTEAHGPQALHRVGTPKLEPTQRLQDRYFSSAPTPALGKSCAETGTRPNGLHLNASFSFVFSLSSSACLCLTFVFNKSCMKRSFLIFDIRSGEQDICFLPCTCVPSNLDILKGLRDVDSLCVLLMEALKYSCSVTIFHRSWKS